MFNNATQKVIKDTFKQQIKPTWVKGIYLTKDQHLQGIVNWLVKDPEA
jgi:hypothetical protein